MRLISILSALCLATLGSDAFALTGALTVNACPEDPGASTIVNCSGGGSISLITVIQTQVDVSDAVAIDAEMDLTLLAGTFDDSPFWNFDDSSAPACATHQPSYHQNLLPPPGTCASFTQLFNQGAAAATLRTPAQVRLAMTTFSGSVVPVVAGTRLFVAQIQFDLANALESGGTCAGCRTPVRVDLLAAAVRSNGASAGDGYDYVCWHSDCPPPMATITINDIAVPVQRRSWGALKAMYR